MKFLEITVGTSLNPSSGEQWYKADAKVSVGEGESPDDVFAQAKKKIDEWLPNPFKENTVKAVDEPVDSPDKALIDTMNYCTRLSQLEQFRPQVERRNNQEVTKAFELKLKSLQ